MKPRKPLPRSTKPIKRSPLKRSTKPIAKGKPPRKKRLGKPRPGRVEGKEMDALRAAAWKRDDGLCGFCHKPCDPDNWQLAHKRAKRRHKDGLDNVMPAHFGCHDISHKYGPSMEKPVKKKGL